MAAGGSLYQDLPAQMPDALRHSYQAERIAVGAAGSCGACGRRIQLAAILGTEELMTNSFHHQAVKQPADRFAPVAWAADGVIEGIEAPARRFALAVQWHPEGMFRTDPLARRAVRRVCRGGAGAKLNERGERIVPGAASLHAPAATIGVFDSGVGGLSVVREIMAQLPAHPLIYLADQAHAPYGQRPLAEIRAAVRGDHPLFAGAGQPR